MAVVPPDRREPADDKSFLRKRRAESPAALTAISAT
jgi:hypothetical protein